MTGSDTHEDDVSRLALRSLGLKPGMALQTRRLVAGAHKREGQYLGAIEGKGVMVGPLGSEGQHTQLSAGDVCVVRGFTGQYEFSFLSRVLQTFEKPFAYALLAYPPAVDARLVRRSMRTKVSWPCSVRVLDDRHAPAEEAILVDLSCYGAMIRMHGALAGIGTQLELRLQVQIEHASVELLIAAKICHNNRAAYEDAHFIGMAFHGLSAQDQKVLSHLASHAATDP